MNDGFSNLNSEIFQKQIQEQMQEQLQKQMFDRMQIQQEILKTIVVEVVAKNFEDANYQKQQDFLMQIGMEKVLERERFQHVKQMEEDKVQTTENKNVKQVDKNSVALENLLVTFKSNNETKSEYKIVLADESELISVLEFLVCNFNKYYGCIPTEEKLRDDIKKKFIYIAKKEKEIIGVLHFQKTDKMVEIRHLAVGEKWRGKGVAKQLMRVYQNEIKVSKKIVWTGKENESAQRLYQKCGYQKDGYVSTVFLMDDVK